MQFTKTKNSLETGQLIAVIIALLSVVTVNSNGMTETKIVPDDPGEMEFFGFSVSISGNYAIAGASRDNDGYGAAYIFIHLNDEWEQQQKLVGENLEPIDMFGSSVGIDGDYAIVGAPAGTFDVSRDELSGSAHIFVREDEEWVQQVELIPDDGEAGDEFGNQVAIYGEYAIVGARYDDHVGENAGSVYVFHRTDEEWTQTQKITADDAAELDNFGAAIALNNQWIVIGSPDDKNEDGFPRGAVYFFHLEEDEWTQHSKITAEDNAGPIWFGMSVSISGDYVAASKWSESEEVPGPTGYVFKFEDDSWTQQARITGEDGEIGEWITAVAIEGDYIILGNCCDDDPARFTGSAYLFTRDRENWNQIEKIQASDGREGAHFGSAVAMDDGNILISAWGDWVDDINQSGSAYIYSEFTEDVADSDIELPSDYDLVSVYPNPFNSTTKITYNLPYGSYVSLSLFDLSGREAKTVVNSYQPSGTHTTILNSNNLVTGTYFIQLAASGKTAKRSVILIR